MGIVIIGFPSCARVAEAIAVRLASEPLPPIVALDRIVIADDNPRMLDPERMMLEIIESHHRSYQFPAPIEKETAHQRANPNQPFYMGLPKYQRRARRERRR